MNSLLTSLSLFFNKTAMNRFYVSKSIYAFAESLISLFLPIYFYNLHFSLSTIFIFFAINSILHTSFMLPATHLCHRYGVVRVFLSGISSYVLFYVGIYALGDNLSATFLYGLAILYGVGSALFWTGYHFYIAWHSEMRQNGKELSTLKIISNLCSSLGPLFGGLIIVFANFQVLFAIAAIIMFFSVFPLIRIERIMISKPPKFNAILTHAFKNKKEFLAFAIAFSSECNTQDLIWPLFILVSGIVTYVGLGGIYAVSYVLLIIVTHLVGHYTDKHKGGVLFSGTIAMSALNVFRAFWTSAGNLFPLHVLSAAIGTTINIPFDSLCYERARKTDMTKYIVFREISINIGTFLFFITAALFPNFHFLFLLASAGGLFYLLFLLPVSHKI